MTDTRYTALVLAASRGNQDPLAQAGGVSHKCFIDIAGQPMLRRVVEAVAQSGRVKKIIVQIEPESTEEAKKILAPLGLKNMVFTPSSTSIGTSVAIAVEAFPDCLPLIITTGDNALHTGEMVKFFCDALDSVTDDGALGLTPASYVMEKYPEGNRAFHRFRDGQFSSCNLYALLTPKAVSAAKIFNSGGQFGKKPKRLIGAFGLFAFLVYKSRMATLATMLRFLSGVLKMKTAPVVMPFAEGPIDVDRMVDWELANRIISEREGGGTKPAAAKAAAKKPAAKPKAAPAAEKASTTKARTAAAPAPEPAPVPKPVAKKPAAKKPAAPKAKAASAPAPAAEAKPAPKPAPKKAAARKTEAAPARAPEPAPVPKPAAKKAAVPKTKSAPAVPAPAKKPATPKTEAKPATAPKKAAAPKAKATPAAKPKAPAKPRTAPKK